MIWLLGGIAAGVTALAYIEGGEVEERERAERRQRRLERQTREREEQLYEQQQANFIRQQQALCAQMRRQTLEAIDDVQQQGAEQEAIKVALSQNIEQSLIAIQSISQRLLLTYTPKRQILKEQLAQLQARRAADVQALEAVTEQQLEAGRHYYGLIELLDRIDNARLDGSIYDIYRDVMEQAAIRRFST
ncbi:hypothetical protein [Psychrobacter jeotgali]|uniref:hypothetical protein n=1 Tax=Psychrobacter jeotgali TaxID=179010 RepID=UPI00191AD58B|nr:hypothetical protein [Psychrobacter jeotgali]